MTDVMSRVFRVTYGKRESTSTALESNQFASYVGNDGTLFLELHRTGQRRSEVLETYRFEFSPEDADLALQALQDWKRRMNAA
jgi:hypothetical protein